jgi:hypothetical protein
MTDDAAKDPAVARALAEIPVPDYEPGFWDRLEAQLLARGGGGPDAHPGDRSR